MKSSQCRRKTEKLDFKEGKSETIPWIRSSP